MSPSADLVIHWAKDVGKRLLSPSTWGLGALLRSGTLYMFRACGLVWFSKGPHSQPTTYSFLASRAKSLDKELA